MVDVEKAAGRARFWHVTGRGPLARSHRRRDPHPPRGSGDQADRRDRGDRRDRRRDVREPAGAQLRLDVQASPDSSGHWLVQSQRSGDNTPSDRDGAALDGVVSALLPANRFIVGGVTVDASAAQVSGSLCVAALPV